VIEKLGHVFGTILGAIGVSVFFILSGYGLQESFYKNSRNSFLDQKDKKGLVAICLFIFACDVVDE